MPVQQELRLSPQSGLEGSLFARLVPVKTPANYDTALSDTLYLDGRRSVRLMALKLRQGDDAWPEWVDCQCGACSAPHPTKRALVAPSAGALASCGGVAGAKFASASRARRTDPFRRPRRPERAESFQSDLDIHIKAVKPFFFRPSLLALGPQPPGGLRRPIWGFRTQFCWLPCSCMRSSVVERPDGESPCSSLAP